MPGLAIAEGRGSGGGTAAEEQRVQSLPECLSIKRANILMPDLRRELTQTLLKAGALLGRIEWSFRHFGRPSEDRKSGGMGKRLPERVDFGDRILTKQKKQKTE